MEMELAEKLVFVLNECGFDASVYENYSGRCMYGKSTPGVDTEASIGDILTSVIMFADEFIDRSNYPLFNDIKKIRSDQLGLGMIYY